MKTIANWLNPRGIDLPLSEAVTGWELCREIRQVVREEWRRVNMRKVQETVTPGKPTAPACGVVGCLAGWGLTLRHVDFLQEEGMHDEQLMQLLGRDVQYEFPTDALTAYQSTFHVFNDGRGDACSRTKPGTRAHARAVVKRLDRFMALNEKALKARILPPLGQLTGGTTIVPDQEAR